MVRTAKGGIGERQLIGAGEVHLRACGAEDTLVLIRFQHPRSFICRQRDYRMESDTVFIYSAEVAGSFGYWAQVLRLIFFSKGCQSEVLRILGIIKRPSARRRGNEEWEYGGGIARTIEKVVADHYCKNGIWNSHGMNHDLGDGVAIGNMNEMEIVPDIILTLYPAYLAKQTAFHMQKYLAGGGPARSEPGATGIVENGKKRINPTALHSITTGRKARKFAAGVVRGKADWRKAKRLCCKTFVLQHSLLFAGVC